MKKADRILTHEEFQEIAKTGKRLKSENYLVRYRANKLERARVGITVSKKNGNAVTRNLIKRQIRASIDRNFEFAKPIDLVVVARFSYNPAKGRENEIELSALLHQIGAQEIETE